MFSFRRNVDEFEMEFLSEIFDALSKFFTNGYNFENNVPSLNLPRKNVFCALAQ